MTDTTKLMSDLVEAKTEVAVLTAAKSTVETELTTLKADKVTLETELASVKEELETAKGAKPEGFDETVAEVAEAKAFLSEQLNHLRVAVGEAKLEEADLPKTVAELKAEISKRTGDLTSILPVGGVSKGAGSAEEDAKLSINPAAYSVRN